MTDFITNIFNTIGTIIERFVALLVSLFDSVVDIFWVEATGSGETAVAGHLTVVGTLMLIALATGLVMWAFRFIRSLIRVKAK